jgi:hypothetical protein
MNLSILSHNLWICGQCKISEDNAITKRVSNEQQFAKRCRW